MAYVSQESICKSLLTDANKAKKKGNFEQAEALYLEALERLESAAGPVHPRLAAVLLRLGDFYNTCVRYGDAERIYRRALSIYEHAFGKNNLDVAIALQYLSEVLDAQGRHEEADEIRQRSKEILSTRLGSLGRAGS